MTGWDWRQARVEERCVPLWTEEGANIFHHLEFMKSVQTKSYHLSNKAGTFTHRNCIQREEDVFREHRSESDLARIVPFLFGGTTSCSTHTCNGRLTNRVDSSHPLSLSLFTSWLAALLPKKATDTSRRKAINPKFCVIQSISLYSSDTTSRFRTYTQVVIQSSPITPRRIFCTRESEKMECTTHLHLFFIHYHTRTVMTQREPDSDSSFYLHTPHKTPAQQGKNPSRSSVRIGKHTTFPHWKLAHTRITTRTTTMSGCWRFSGYLPALPISGSDDKLIFFLQWPKLDNAKKNRTTTTSNRNGDLFSTQLQMRLAVDGRTTTRGAKVSLSPESVPLSRRLTATKRQKWHFG